MSLPSSTEPALPGPRPAAAPTQKQKTNIYTMMLLISFAAIVLACTLLYLELTLEYTYPWWKTNEAAPAATSWRPSPVTSIG